MAKDSDWETIVPADDSGWETIIPANQGRVSINPPADAPLPNLKPAASPVKPPSVEAREDKGIIQRVGEFFRPEYKSVLEDAKPTPQEKQAELDRRLSYNAGPISRETVAKADFSRSGMLVTDDKTVNKVAAAM